MKGFNANKQAMTKREVQENIQGRAQFAVNTALQAIQNVRQLSHTIQGIANTLRSSETSEAAVKGDTVLVDYLGQLLNDDGTLGQAFKGGTDFGAAVEIGSNGFVPGFEEQLVGLKAGETSNLKITFPENYNEATLAGKSVNFFVQVIKVYREKESAVEALQKKLAGEAAAKVQEQSQEKSESQEA
jgi:trigger factor